MQKCKDSIIYFSGTFLIEYLLINLVLNKPKSENNSILSVVIWHPWSSKMSLQVPLFQNLYCIMYSVKLTGCVLAGNGYLGRSCCRWE